MRHHIPFVSLTISLILMTAAAGVFALEPPTAEQLERYRSDGTLAARVGAAQAFGNHRMAPQLAARAIPGAALKALPDGPKVLPSNGAPAVLTLLIAFDDMLGYTDSAVVEDRVFGDGDELAFPYESLTEFYRRSSYDQLEITGSVLGWYTTPYPRADVVETYVGRQTLIKEVINHFDDEGHDFSQYDNDGDGFMDYVAIIWTGAHGEWAEFWWGYQTSFWNDDFTVDGVQIGTYSWQWENYNWPGEFTPEVLIHETGHALGLPDYYDYDDTIGPRGGCGGLDQMDSNWGDHNAYSKWVLGWLQPEIYNQDLHSIVLATTDQLPDAAVLMHGDPVTDPYGEYFIIQNRRSEGNDLELPNSGVLVWHVDARVDDNGYFLYDNSYTEHKLLRLMEADGLEEIERGGRADAGDFYGVGDTFGTDTVPNSRRYDGVSTNLFIESISNSWAGFDKMVVADLGSGCALWCDSSVSPNAWPGVPVGFNGSLDTANCEGAPSYGWIFGDGASSSDTSASHAYVSTGTWNWSVDAALEDAVCAHNGTVNVCTDFSCWQWYPVHSMNSERAQHATVVLEDGRILVVGGANGTPEVFDPRTETWAIVEPTNSVHESGEAVRLDDGRVLMVGVTLDPLASCEIFDPADDSWTVTTPPNHPRAGHSALKLADGRVLIVGGVIGGLHFGTPVEEVEVFDPASETWTVTGSLAGIRIFPGLVNLHDGRALIVGGRQATIFDPVGDTLTRATPLPDDWWFSPVAVTLEDGRVLMSGVVNGGMTLLWDPANGRLSIGGAHATYRQGATATRLSNDFVLVTGGLDTSGRALDSTEFFDPTTLKWSTGSSLVTARGVHTASLTNSGRLILIGGATASEPWGDSLSDVEVFVQPTTPPRNIGGRSSP